MKATLIGQLYAARASAARPATLTLVAPGVLRLDSDAGSETLRLAELRVSPRLGNTPRRITLPDQRLLVTTDNDAVDQLLSSAGRDRRHAWLHRMESRWGWVGTATLLTIGLMWLLIQYGLPAAADAVARQLPPAAGISMTEQALRQLDGPVLRPSTLPVQTQERLAARFAEVTDSAGGGFRYEITFRRGGDMLGANALAFPSGLVIMTDELVELAEHDEELVAIMAHEVGHVVYRHGLRQALQGAALGIVFIWLTGDVSSLFGSLPIILTQLGYSREFEREADRYARDWLLANDIPLQRFADIMLRLEQGQDRGRQGRLGGYLSTHPATGDRVEAFLEPAR